MAKKRSKRKTSKKGGRRSRKRRAVTPRVQKYTTPLLDVLLGSTARARILRYVYRHPEHSFNARQLAHALILSPRSVVKECDALSKIGVLKSRSGGRGRSYQASSAFAFSGEMRAMALYSNAVSPGAITSDIQQKFRPKLIAISGIFLNVPNTPVDIVIIGEGLTDPALARVMKKFEAQLGAELRWTALSNKDFLYRWQMFDRFLRSIFEGPHEILLGKLPK